MSSDIIPVIDVSALLDGEGNSSRVATQIENACRESGFFYIVGHGVSESLQQRLEDVSCAFFAQDLETKMRIRMELAEARGADSFQYHPVSNLSLSADSHRRGRIDVERWRAHRLRIADDSKPGPNRRFASEDERPVDRGTGNSRFVSLKHRRHARSDDGRALSFDTPSSSQSRGCWPILLSFLL